MAYTYEREDSPWLWISFLDAAGKRKRQATEIRRGSPDAKRKAKRLEAEYIERELELPRKVNREELWQNWVPGYLVDRYGESPKTLLRAKQAWFALHAFLEQKDIQAPRGLEYSHLSGYMAWRQSAKSGLRKVGHNTARLELTFLKVIMSQAVRLGHARSNPCRELEVARKEPKKKREVTLEEERKIEATLADKPAWMRESWSIYMRQGCRLSEAEVPMDRIEEDATPPLITFKLKGGRLHTTTLHPELIPLVKKAREEKRATLVTLAPAAAKVWTDFFESLGIENLSLHCTRVTVISRLVRAGEDSVFVRQFIGHSSDSVQAIYRRLRPVDASSLMKHLGGRSSCTENPDEPQATPPRAQESSSSGT